ncbi:MAG: glycosyltransferase, partial [Arenicellales bacterium]|nr:glycosyltransferase [Arenicellales bacterium]
MTIPKISIIVPALNEASHITEVLGRLQAFRKRGHEVIVVDGGSSDATVLKAASSADHVVFAPRGRAEQLAAGTHRARHSILWFVHADTMV